MYTLKEAWIKMHEPKIAMQHDDALRLADKIILFTHEGHVAKGIQRDER